MKTPRPTSGILFRDPVREEVGQELLEMAFVLPILLVLLIGIISFGRAYNVYQTITRAAREGARQSVLTLCATCAASTTGCTNGASATSVPSSSTIKSCYVDPALQAVNLDATNSTYTTSYKESYLWLDAAAATPQQCGLSVSFTYPYQVILPFSSVNLTTLNLHTQVQMRLENQPTTGTCP